MNCYREEVLRWFDVVEGWHRCSTGQNVGRWYMERWDFLDDNGNGPRRLLLCIFSCRVTVSTSLDCGKKEIQRVSKKINQIVFRVEKDFFTTTRGMEKKLQAKQNRFGFQIFFEATKK